MSVGMQNLVAGSILATISLFVTDFSNIHPTSDSIWALGYLILFGTILSLTCYMYMLEHLPVSVSSTFSYVTPVVATIFGALVLHEPVTWNIVVGIATILLGVFLVQLGNQQKVSQKKISPQTQPVVSTNARRSSSDTTPESQPKTASV
jgi:drug/metabolite transporter (DMT)-like permease